jgi:hypothetical protein
MLVCKCCASSRSCWRDLAQGQISALFGNARAVGFNGQHGSRGQSGQVAFEQVIAGTVAHGLHGDVLADFTRHEDEGHQFAQARTLSRAARPE